MPKHERMLEFYLNGDLVRSAYDAYINLSDRTRQALISTPVFSRLYYALSRETFDGNLAAPLDRDFSIRRRTLRIE